MIFRLLNTGRESGGFNMRFDEELAAGPLAELPVLRLYGWSPPAVSIGRHQSPDDLDTNLLARDGIDVVRRPTGGRAILHWNELTYSAVLPLAGRSLREVYLFLNEGVLAGLRTLGVDAELTGVETDFREAYRQPSSIPCFSTSARNEIHAGGRKLVGSAQRRYGDVVLQHGSILLGPEHARITDYLALPDGASRAAMRAALERSTVDLRELLGREVTFAEAAAALCRGFAERWDIAFRELELPTPISSH